MLVVEYTYLYGDSERSLTMLVIGGTADEPVGFEAWKMAGESGWMIDDDPTVIVHPIVRRKTVGKVRGVILFGAS